MESFYNYYLSEIRAENSRRNLSLFAAFIDYGLNTQFHTYQY